jgi:hypothetical protein
VPKREDFKSGPGNFFNTKVIGKRRDYTWFLLTTLFLANSLTCSMEMGVSWEAASRFIGRVMNIHEPKRCMGLTPFMSNP